MSRETIEPVPTTIDLQRFRGQAGRIPPLSAAREGPPATAARREVLGRTCSPRLARLCGEAARKGAPRRHRGPVLRGPQEESYRPSCSPRQRFGRSGSAGMRPTGRSALSKARAGWPSIAVRGDLRGSPSTTHRSRPPRAPVVASLVLGSRLPNRWSATAKTGVISEGEREVCAHPALTMTRTASSTSTRRPSCSASSRRRSTSGPTSDGSRL